MDSRGGYISKILYVETKESGPVGGVRRVCPPRSANDRVEHVLGRKIRANILVKILK